MKGKLYLLPITLGESDAQHVIPQAVIDQTLAIRHFIVENVRTTRRFLRKLDPGFPIDDSQFFELNKHTKASDLEHFLKPSLQGHHMGLMSEAGVPGVADPGADVVMMAHKNKIQVIPLVGPSSILMLVMASGLNGQNFAFNGYLPVKTPDRIKKIKALEKRSLTEHQLQLFIETPYRNEALYNNILENCHNNTRLTIGVDLSLPSEQVYTRTIDQWKNSKIDLKKRPAIFGLQA